MPFGANVYRVLIASPSDVREERIAVRDAVNAWNTRHTETMGMVALPLMWETDVTPSYGKPPQDVISGQIVKSCDLLVGIFAARLGTPTTKAASGTVQEINEVHAQGKPVLLYFSTKPVSPTALDPEQLQLLNGFKQQIQAKAFYHEFGSIEDLRRDVTDHLLAKFRELSRTAPAVDWKPPPPFVVDGDTLTFRSNLEFEDYFATEPDRETCVLEHCRIVLSAATVSHMKDLLPVLELLSRSQEPFLLIAPKIEEEALSTIVRNHVKGTLKACAVRVPNMTRDLLKEIRAFSGAHIFGELRFSLEHAQIQDLGTVERVITKPGSTVLFRASNRVNRPHLADAEPEYR